MAIPVDETVLKTFDVLQNDEAYNKGCIEETSQLAVGIKACADLLDLFDLPEFSDYADQLREHIAPEGTIAQFKEHLNYQFDNLPTNLMLMSSYINTMSNMARLPGFDTVANGSGGLAGVSFRALMINYAAETGAGSGGANGKGKCAGMGDAFGSIMGKASQLAGLASGGLGGLMNGLGGMLGGGMLGAISKLGNMAGLANVPGIGNIGSLIGGLSSGAPNLGGIGSLLSNIGQSGALSALGPVAGMLGGNLSKLTSLGGALQSLGSLTGAMSGLGTLGSVNPQQIVNQLGGVSSQITSFVPTQLVSQMQGIVGSLGAAGITPSTGSNGAPANITGQLANLAGFMGTPGNIAKVGDVTSLITGLNGISANLPNIAPGLTGTGLSSLTSQIGSVTQGLGVVNGFAGAAGQLNSLPSIVSALGGNTGFGNVGNLLGSAQGLMSKLGGLGSIGSLAGLTNLPNLMGGLSGMIGQLGNMGNIGSMLGGLSGMAGNLSGLMGGLGGKISSMFGGMGGIGSLLGAGGLGNITSLIGGQMGGLGGIMGSLKGLMGGEKGLLGGATNMLKIVAGSFNLKALFGDPCGKGVLGNVASDKLKDAAGGSDTPTGTGTGSGDSALPALDLDDPANQQTAITGDDTKDFKGEIYESSQDNSRGLEQSDFQPNSGSLGSSNGATVGASAPSAPSRSYEITAPDGSVQQFTPSYIPPDLPDEPTAQQTIQPTAPLPTASTTFANYPLNLSGVVESPPVVASPTGQASTPIGATGAPTVSSVTPKAGGLYE